MAVYFFYGDEDYNIDLELEKMRSKLNPDFLSMSYKALNHPDFDNLITSLLSSPMMFGSSLVTIDIYKYFFKEGNETYNFDDKQVDEIEEALKNNQEGLDVVFYVRTARADGKKIDSRRKLFKVLSQFNVKEFQQLPSYKTDELSNWIRNRAKEKNIKINNNAISILIEQIGTNLKQFDNELDKLKLLAYPDNNITEKMVKENGVANQDLFNITNFLLKNEKSKAVLELKQLLDKKHPLEIISALQTMIRQWIIIKSKSSVQDIMKLTGIRSDYRIKLLKGDLKEISLKDLVELKNNLYKAECNIKSGQSTDNESEVEIAIIR